MKKLNKNGVSLAETLGAITVLGIVLGVALTVVNSRAKQLNIINTEMVTLFELTDDSNRYYLQDSTSKSTPTKLNEKASYHIIQTGEELKNNSNIEATILEEINADTTIINDKEYLLSYIQKGDKWYHIIRLTSYTPDNQIRIGDILFPNLAEDPDELVTPKKPETSEIKSLMDSENNMAKTHTDIIIDLINLKLAEALNKNVPQGIPSPQELYNKSIFTDGSNNSIPTKVEINKISPLTLQVKLYNPKGNTNTNPTDGENIEVHFLAILDCTFEDQTVKQIKVYGKFLTNYHKGDIANNIPDQITNINPSSAIKNNEQHFIQRFYDEKDLEMFKNKITNEYAIKVTTNPKSPITLEVYAGNNSKSQLELVTSLIGDTIANYIDNQLNGGNELTNA